MHTIVYNDIKLKNRIYVCDICKKSFVPNHSTQKYCSKNCKKKSWAKIKAIQREKNRDGFNAYDRAYYAKQKGYQPKQEIKCCMCGDIFLRKSINQKYCKKEECHFKFYAKKGLEKYYKNAKQIMERRKNNKKQYMLQVCRSRLRDLIIRKKAIKITKTTTLIGCSLNVLFEHIEKQFKEGMSWENYGKKGWELDHIIPCINFDTMTFEGQKACFHYTNLQPLWGRDNRRKHTKVVLVDN